MRATPAAPLLLALLVWSSAALSLDETQERAEPDATDPSSPPAVTPASRDGVRRAAEALLGVCSVGAAAAGSFLCASAGPLVGGGYVAAGASGVVTALSMRRARAAADRLAQSAQQLADSTQQLALAHEMRNEHAIMHGAIKDVRASGEQFSTSLWRAVQGKQNDNLAASLERSERLELLRLLQALNADEGGAPLSDADLLAAEHYLLRTIPQRSVQALILAASRASVAFAQLPTNGVHDTARRPTTLDGARADGQRQEALGLPRS